jgi:hypothetical protein
MQAYNILESTLITGMMEGIGLFLDRLPVGLWYQGWTSSSNVTHLLAGMTVFMIQRASIVLLATSILVIIMVATDGRFAILG